MAAKFIIHRDDEHETRWRWFFQSANGVPVFRSCNNFEDTRSAEKSVKLAKRGIKADIEVRPF